MVDLVRPVTPARFHAILSTERDRWNALVADARRRWRHFDLDRFRALLEGPIGSAVEAAEAEVPGSGRDVHDVLFRSTVELVGRQLHRPDSALDILWEAFTLFGAALAHDPVRVIPGLSNAILTLDEMAGLWLERLVGPISDPSTAPPGGQEPADRLLDGGLVAAWSLGLADLRPTALDAADRLVPGDLASALGVGSIPRGCADRLRTDRWWRPDIPQQHGIIATPGVGGFRGWGGQFLRLPTVWRAEDNRLYVSTPDDGPWLIHADIYGSILTRVPVTNRIRSAVAVTGSTIRAAGMEIEAVGRVTAAAVTKDTVAWTTDRTYRVSIGGIA